MQATNITVENFEEGVITPSMERPVVLEFTSSRYNECIAFNETLEKLSGELQFTLGKVNLDDPQNGQFIQIFRISSLPFACVISQGENADVLQGNLTEKSMKERLEKFFISKEEKLKQDITDAIERHDYNYANVLLSEALKNTPNDESLRLLQAKSLIGLGESEKAKEILLAFSTKDACYTEAKSLLDLQDFYVEAAKNDTVEGADATYRAACVEASNKNYKAALEILLSMVKTDKEWSEGKAKKAMMTLFNVLGPKHALTWEFRAKLNTLLFI